MIRLDSSFKLLDVISSQYMLVMYKYVLIQHANTNAHNSTNKRSSAITYIHTQTTKYKINPERKDYKHAYSYTNPPPPNIYPPKNIYI